MGTAAKGGVRDPGHLASARRHVDFLSVLDHVLAYPNEEVSAVADDVLDAFDGIARGSQNNMNGTQPPRVQREKKKKKRRNTRGYRGGGGGLTFCNVTTCILVI